MHPHPTYVFDLDETLIHSSERPLNGEQFVKHVEIVLKGDKRLYVHIRPGARSLLTELLKLQCARYLRVGIWTAATAEYARKIVQMLVGERSSELAFLKTRRDCTDIGTYGRPQYVKDLRQVGPPTPRIVLIDDNVDNINLNRIKGYSTILAYPFLGLRKDRELNKLLVGILAALRMTHKHAFDTVKFRNNSRNLTSL